MSGRRPEAGEKRMDSGKWFGMRSGLFLVQTY
jgi:hypothetical protein